MLTAPRAEPASAAADGVELLLGALHSSARPRIPFDPAVLALLEDLSAELMRGPGARAHPDVHTFAFWCRRANLQRLAAEHEDGRARLGLGLVFHVAPGNVPVNFAFSLAFGLLAGNANIVRAPSRPMEQLDRIRDALETVLSRPERADLAELVTLVRYPAGHGFTADISARADGRVIWGGDETVKTLRALPTPPRAREVCFPDRYSFCVMEADAVMAAEESALRRLADGFYNDTYLMDQNACSSPHLVVWRGTRDAARAARSRFWDALEPIVEARYALSAVHAVDKYAAALEAVAQGEADLRGLERRGAGLCALDWKRLPEDLEARRTGFGLFHEHAAESLDALAPLITGRFQTLTYFGAEPEALQRFVIENRLPGVDRIVPVGRALDMDVIWDGYDLIGALSRIIDRR